MESAMNLKSRSLYAEPASPGRDWKRAVRRFFVGAFCLAVLIISALIALGSLLA
jgi:hypothetical protein